MGDSLSSIVGDSLPLDAGLVSVPRLGSNAVSHLERSLVLELDAGITWSAVLSSTCELAQLIAVSGSG